MVGGAPEEIKRQQIAQIESRLADHNASLLDVYKALREREYPKNLSELAVISFINKRRNTLRAEAGMGSWVKK